MNLSEPVTLRAAIIIAGLLNVSIWLAAFTAVLELKRQAEKASAK